MLVAWTDSDRGGCRETRKSKSGGAECASGHTFKSWSVGQNGVALSSANMCPADMILQHDMISVWRPAHARHTKRSVQERWRDPIAHEHIHVSLLRKPSPRQHTC